MKLWQRLPTASMSSLTPCSLIKEPQCGRWAHFWSITTIRGLKQPPSHLDVAWDQALAEIRVEMCCTSRRERAFLRLEAARPMLGCV